MSAWKCAAGQIRLAPVEAVVGRVGLVEDIRPSVVAEGQRLVGWVAVCECVVVAAAGGQAFHRHPDTHPLTASSTHTESTAERQMDKETRGPESNVEDKQIR